jgi:hypothetical protein
LWLVEESELEVFILGGFGCVIDYAGEVISFISLEDAFHNARYDLSTVL